MTIEDLYPEGFLIEPDTDYKMRILKSNDPKSSFVNVEYIDGPLEGAQKFIHKKFIRPL
jgi:hypothetical protein